MGERGSVLMLMPAAVLIVMLLGAIAVDLSHVHLAQRELQSVTTAAANDATALLAEEVYRSGAGYAIDQARATAVVDTLLQLQDLPGPIVSGPVVRVSGDQIDVTVAVEVQYLFASAVPGLPESAEVEVSVSANVD